jgi:hypothetical protein
MRRVNKVLQGLLLGALASWALSGCAKTESASTAAQPAATATDATALANAATGTAADAGAGDHLGPAGFGEACPAAGVCPSAMTCFAYGDGIKRCTLPCKTAADCPGGASGAGCNGKGYCKP